MSDERAAFFERLYAHMEWANELVLQSLQDNTGAKPMELFGHLLGAEEIWLARLEQRTARLGVWPVLSHAECAEASAASIAGYRAFRSGLSSADWERPCHYANSAGDTFSSRVDDILMHVALHGTYHRGQVSSMVRNAGGDPAPTDFIAFVRGAPAATRSDAQSND